MQHNRGRGRDPAGETLKEMGETEKERDEKESDECILKGIAEVLLCDI